MRMIKRAVEQRADDATSSTRWAGLLPLGNIEEAVKHLERAIELKPEIRPSTITSAMLTGGSDASSRRVSSGRMRVTSSRAEDLIKIEQKLKSGLADETSAPGREQEARRR